MPPTWGADAPFRRSVVGIFRVPVETARADRGYGDPPEPGYGDRLDPGYGDAAASPRRRIGGGRHRRSAWFWPAIGLAVVGAVVVVVALVQGGSKTGTGAVPGALVTTF